MIRSIATSVHDRALFGKGVVFENLIAIPLNISVQIRNVLCNQQPARVVPGPVADAITRIDGRLVTRSRGAEIGMPRSVSDAGCHRQCLAVGISAGKPAKVSALT